MYQHSVSTRVKLLLILMALLMLSIPTRAQTGEAEIDNCCFVDRQCTTNYDWVAGYYAFQNNHCDAALRQQQAQHQLRQNQGASSEINNCCFTGWQCHADEEWRGGYYAFQEDQCASSPADWQAQWQSLFAEEEATASGNQEQQRSDQATDGTASTYQSKRCDTPEGGTPVCIIVYDSWDEYWRAVCRTYPDMHDHPECQRRSRKSR